MRATINTPTSLRRVLAALPLFVAGAAIVLSSVAPFLLYTNRADATAITMPTLNLSGKTQQVNNCNISYVTSDPKDQMFTAFLDNKASLDSSRSMYASWLKSEKGGNVDHISNAKDQRSAAEIVRAKFGGLVGISINGCSFDLIAYPPPYNVNPSGLAKSADGGGPSSSFGKTEAWPLYAASQLFANDSNGNLVSLGSNVGSIIVGDDGAIKSITYRSSASITGPGISVDGLSNFTNVKNLVLGTSSSTGGTPGNSPTSTDGATSISSATVEFFSRAQLNVKLSGKVGVGGTEYAFSFDQKMYDTSVADTTNKFDAKNADGCNSFIEIDAKAADLLNKPAASYPIKSIGLYISASSVSGLTTTSTCIPLVYSIAQVSNSRIPKSLPSGPSGTISVSNPTYQSGRRSQFKHYFVSQDEIREVAGGGDQYLDVLKRIDAPSLFNGKPAFEHTGDKCGGEIWVQDNATPDALQLHTRDSRTSCDSYTRTNRNILVLSATDAKDLINSPDQQAAIQSGTTAVGSGTGDDNVNCETSGNPLSWIICPIINGALDGANVIFSKMIEPFLQTSPITTDDSSENTVYQIWKSFRTLGNIVLIFALLLIVFGQSIGGGLVDAYTAKKTLPRILVAAIAINLSIYICAALVDIFNVLGHGMSHLVTSPLKSSTANGTNGLGIRPKAGDTAIVGTILIILGLLAGSGIWLIFKAQSPDASKQSGGAGALLAYILFFVVLPIILAAFTVFITLVIRQGIILALTIISPVALAMFALPSADKYAKKWMDAFIKTLMVYPIITLIFGISQVLAVLIYEANPDHGALALIATVIVAFAPLFMIPLAFKLAGGVIGTAAGAITNGRERLKKAYGDDKHNPYSARNRLMGSARDDVMHRGSVGAANFANSSLGKYVTGEGLRNQGKVNQAGIIAQQSAEAAYDARIRTSGGTVNQTDRRRAGSLAAGAAMNAVRGGLSAEQAATVADSVATTALNHPFYKDESITAAGTGAIDALKRGFTPEAAAMAGNAAAQLTELNYKPEQVTAGTRTVADLAKSGMIAPGSPLTMDAARAAARNVGKGAVGQRAAATAAVEAGSMGVTATAELDRISSNAANLSVDQHRRLSSAKTPAGTPAHTAEQVNDASYAAAAAAARADANPARSGGGIPTRAAQAAADAYVGYTPAAGAALGVSSPAEAARIAGNNAI